MRRVKLVSQEGQFALTEDEEGRQFLEVLCGGFAMYEVEMQLERDEISKYLAQGESFLLSLAGKIRRKSVELGGRVREK